MVNLVVGGNHGLQGTSWSLRMQFAHDIRHELGLALLMSDAAHQLIAPVHLAHLPKQAWVSIQLTEDGKTYELTLNATELPAPNITRLALVVYRYGACGPITVGKTVQLTSVGVFNYTLDLEAVSASAMIVGEFYLKNAMWKIRALAETSAYGLAALGRRLGADIDESSPHKPPQHEAAEHDAWTGSAFLVAPQVLMTNAHVVEEAKHIQLSSIQGKVAAEVILSDTTNDLALLRAAVPAHISVLPFRAQGAGLAEAVTALGYPLASLMGSGIQVTQGVISGLFGAYNDIRLLQFTAPIQPGSSGSPLLDATGAVVGIVSSSFKQAQNMNFAIRHILALALLEAAQIPYQLQTQTQSLSAAQIVNLTQQAIWRVDCTS